MQNCPTLSSGGCCCYHLLTLGVQGVKTPRPAPGQSFQAACTGCLVRAGVWQQKHKSQTMILVHLCLNECRCLAAGAPQTPTTASQQSSFCWAIRKPYSLPVQQRAAAAGAGHGDQRLCPGTSALCSHTPRAFRALSAWGGTAGSIQHCCSPWLLSSGAAAPWLSLLGPLSTSTASICIKLALKYQLTGVGLCC